MIWQTPAYRNIYLMMPGIILLFHLMTSSPLLLLYKHFDYLRINLSFRTFLLFPIIATLIDTIFISISTILSTILLGITSSFVGGTIGSLLFFIFFVIITGILGTTLVGIIYGAIDGVSLCWVTLLSKNIVFFDSLTRILIGIILSLIGIIILIMISGTLLTILYAIVGSIAYGCVAFLTLGMENWNFGLSVLFAAIISVLIGGLGVIIGIGALRFISYPFQFIIVVIGNNFFKLGKKHPYEWDELSFLLPYLQKLTFQRLKINEENGLSLIIESTRNVFRLPVVQVILYRYLHSHSDPLKFLYNLLNYNKLEEYVIAPIQIQDWEQNITVRRLIVGELSLQFINPTSGTLSIFLNKFIWWITLPIRHRQHSPLTSFSKMLYNLSDEKNIESRNFDLYAYSPIYKNLSIYPNGQEIIKTFDIIVKFLSYHSLIMLSDAINTVSCLEFDTPIRIGVIKSLRELGEIGEEIRAYCDSTSKINRLAALVRATDALNDLDKYVQQEIMAPEQYLLRRIIRQWQALIIEAGGELGRAESAGPVANPYVAGNPVTGRLFVGRDDILRRLEELWRGAGQKPSVVIYGHRRMGKSSILHNLGARFGKETVIIDFNMQRVGQVENAGELLLNLALAIYDALRGAIALPEPAEDAFLAHNPFTAFDRFLKQLDAQRGSRQFIIAIDEFENIERHIEQGKLTPQLLDYWRGLFQTYSWFVMAFAGLHTLEEMTSDYWQPLFGSVTKIPVSFLSADAVRRLITNPADDFDLDYDADAIERIILLTSGQPYLIQLLCHGLVTRFNRQNFEEDAERERRFHLADVDAVVASPEFFRDGDAYFTGVWAQADNGAQTCQQTLLRLLSRAANGMTIQDLADQSGLSVEQTQSALTLLRRHDVISESDDGWRFTVELMRQWVAQKESNA